MFGAEGGIWAGFTGLLKKHAEDKGEAFARKKIDEIYRNPGIKADIYLYLQDKYGQEVFFNDLDGYIEGNHVVENLISALQGESSIQPINAGQFAEKNIRDFCNTHNRYKRKKVEYSKIRTAFEEIFFRIKRQVLSVDPHSDIGKVQYDIHALHTENQASNAEQIMLLRSIHGNIQQLVDSGRSYGISKTSLEDVTSGSSVAKSFYQKIKDIETEFQDRNLYSEALVQYQKVLMEMLPSLQQSSKTEMNKLICTLYCNMALCYSNLGNYPEAQRSLDQISQESVEQNKRYYLVSALVIVQTNQEKKYADALTMLNKALEIDPDYKGAFRLQKYLEACLEIKPVDEILRELDTYDNDLENKPNNASNLAEYHQYRGLINLVSERYEEALTEMHKALDYGYDKTIGMLNISSILYGQASKSTPKNSRMLKSGVDQKKMIQVVSTLEGILLSEDKTESFEAIKNQAVSLYVTACASLGIPHKLSPIQDYLNDGQEYEVQRCLLLGSSEKLRAEQIELLHPADKLFYQSQLLLDENKDAECFQNLMELADKRDPAISPSTFHLLLQLCLTTKNLGDYWKYRNSAPAYGISGELLLLLDACVYEAEEKIEESKSIFDTLAESSEEDNIIENTLRFYKRHEYNQELTTLYLRTHSLIVAGELYYNNVEDFYIGLEKFFLAQKNSTISDILEQLPERLISEKCRYEMYAQYYIEINDLEKLYACFVKLGCKDGPFLNAFNMALTAARILKYEDALDICNSLNERAQNTEEKVKILWLRSDILLLQGKKNESFSAALEAHDLTIQNPYEPSHQRLMARGMQCGHDEVLANAVEYKHTHPVVVNWLQEIKVTEGPDMGEQFLQKLNEFVPNHKSHIDFEKEIAAYYRRGQLTVYKLLDLYHWDWCRMFSFADRCKLHISSGYIDDLHTEQEYIHSEVVIDWITLSILAGHNCLNLLDYFHKVHMNWNSMVMLQSNFLSYGFPFQQKILAWLRNSPNLVFEADGLVEKESDDIFLFGKDFFACCQIAANLKIPFLYCDSMASVLQKCKVLKSMKNVQFVSIPAACYKAYENREKQLSDCLYSFMKDCQFISFTASTILCQIEKAEYHVTDELMKPFLFCQSTCDMNSFAHVYLLAIYALCRDHREAAIKMADIILRDTLRIIKQTTYARVMAKDFELQEFAIRVSNAEKYAALITSQIQKLLVEVPEYITNQCNLIISYMEHKDV